MIHLTRLNEGTFFLNADHILSVEATPDTLIVLQNGQRLLVKETVDAVVNAAVRYQQRVRQQSDLTRPTPVPDPIEDAP